MENFDHIKKDSKGAGDPHGKPAKEKITSADDADESSGQPSRVHIFKHEHPPSAPTKSDDEPLEYSPFIDPTEERISLKRRIVERKKLLYEAAMKVEDLEAILQGLERNCRAISERRRGLRLTRL